MVRAMTDALSVLGGLERRDLERHALVTDEATWTFAELARRAASAARELEAIGVRQGTRAALVAAPTPAVFVAIHALAAMGATLVPIHPRLSPAEAAVTVEVTAAEVVLDAAALEAVTAAATEAGPSISRNGEALSIEASLGEAPFEEAPFAIVSTSGTTGRPKGAVLSRRAFLASAEASGQNLGWEERDRWLCCMPLAHVGGLSIVTRCLAARRAVVLLPRFDAARVLDAIRRHEVTLLSVVPTMLHALLEADAQGALRLPRAILLGGAPAPAALLEACAERGVRALTTYGLTEACSQVTSQAPRDPRARLAGSGAPLAGFEVRIADERGEALPPRSAGRILVRGAALFDGYLRQGGLGVDPARTAKGFLDTGDLGEIDAQGQLHVHARRTDLIVTGGENVYPAEVEQAIERCAGVRRALVFGVPDARWGQVVAAAIEVDPGAALLLERLAAITTNELAAHKRPRRVALVGELPVTASGKVDRGGAAGRFGAALRPFP